MAYSKTQGRWVAKNLYEAKTYGYAEQLMMDSIRGFEGRIQYEVVGDIARPQNIGKEAMPDKSVSVSSLKSRFIAPAPSVLPDELVNSEENTESLESDEND